LEDGIALRIRKKDMGSKFLKVNTITKGSLKATKDMEVGF
jgi:hypothetical protein